MHRFLCCVAAMTAAGGGGGGGGGSGGGRRWGREKAMVRVSSVAAAAARSRTARSVPAADACGARAGARPDCAASARATHVVPHHDLVRRVARVAAAAHERKDVAAEEHLDHADAAAAEVAPEGLLEGLAVVDAEALVRADSKADCEGKAEPGARGEGCVQVEVS